MLFFTCLRPVFSRVWTYVCKADLLQANPPTHCSNMHAKNERWKSFGRLVGVLYMPSVPTDHRGRSGRFSYHNNDFQRAANSIFCK